jgi:hypothetical protein
MKLLSFFSCTILAHFLHRFPNDTADLFPDNIRFHRYKAL